MTTTSYLFSPTFFAISGAGAQVLSANHYGQLSSADETTQNSYSLIESRTSGNNTYSGHPFFRNSSSYNESQTSNLSGFESTVAYLSMMEFLQESRKQESAQALLAMPIDNSSSFVSEKIGLRLEESEQGKETVSENTTAIITQLEEFEKKAEDSVGKVTLKLLEQLKSERVEGEERNAILAEAEGFLLAIRGEEIGEAKEIKGMPEDIDWGKVSTADFLGWIRTGQIDGKGMQPKRDYKTKQFAKIFYSGGAKVFGNESLPQFFKSVCYIWLGFTKDKVVDFEQVMSFGKSAAEILQSHWRLGRSGGIPQSILKISLHKLDALSLIRSKGWLLGEAERLKSLPENQRDAITLQAALLLEKNQKTILTRAVQTNETKYPVQVAKELHNMLRRLYEFVDELRKSKDKVANEASNLLGGNSAAKNKGNINSVVYYSIRSGKLNDYITDVIEAFRNGQMLEELYSGIARIARESKETAEALKRNKGTIISHALASGKLDYVKEVIEAFEGEDGFLKKLDREIEGLRDRGDKEAVDALEKNKVSIVAHALKSGKLGYVNQVVDAFGGKECFIKQLKREIGKRKRQGRSENVLDFKKCRGPIIYRAINNGNFDVKSHLDKYLAQHRAA